MNAQKRQKLFIVTTIKRLICHSFFIIRVCDAPKG